jgi:hypothetical protein
MSISIANEMYYFCRYLKSKKAVYPSHSKRKHSSRFVESKDPAVSLRSPQTRLLLRPSPTQTENQMVYIRCVCIDVNCRGGT